MINPEIIFPRAPDSPLHYQRYIKFILPRPPRSLTREPGHHIHHIVPKCMKGGNEDGNLIKLTYREHYLSHYLLALAFSSIRRLGKAINSFKESSKNSRVYETLAHHKHSDETRAKIGKSNKGKARPRKVPMSDKERSARAELCKNRVWSAESRQKLKDKALSKPLIQFALQAANRPDRDRTGIKNPRANVEVWSNLGLLHEVWVSKEKCGARKLFRLTGLGNTWQSLRAVVKKFKEDDDIV